MGSTIHTVLRDEEKVEPRCRGLCPYHVARVRWNSEVYPCPFDSKAGGLKYYAKIQLLKL